jgi:uncharacterized protein
VLSFNDFKKNKRLVVKDKKFSFDFDKEIVKSANLFFSFEANKYDDVISVLGTITGTMTFECSRCLKLFEQNISIPFECSFTKEEYECDVTEEVRESVLLNIPMKPLCNKDCKGLCPVCGNNKNEKDCFCEQKIKDEFVAEKWSKIKKLKI